MKELQAWVRLVRQFRLCKINETRTSTLQYFDLVLFAEEDDHDNDNEEDKQNCLQYDYGNCPRWHLGVICVKIKPAKCGIIFYRITATRSRWRWFLAVAIGECPFLPHMEGILVTVDWGDQTLMGRSLNYHQIPALPGMLDPSVVAAVVASSLPLLHCAFSSRTLRPGTGLKFKTVPLLTNRSGTTTVSLLSLWTCCPFNVILSIVGLSLSLR